MNGPRLFSRLLTATTCACLFSMLDAAAAPNPYGDIGVAWRIPGAPIILTRVYSYLTTFPSYLNQVTPLWTNDCVSFLNVSQKSVTAIQFAFAPIDASGKALGSPLLFNVRETIAPGEVRNELDSYCKSYGYGAGKNRYVVGWVNAVKTTDGTSWHAVPPVRGRATNASTSPVRLSSAFATLPLRECVSIRNRSKKTIDHVRLIFRHVAPDGTQLGEDVLDVHSRIPPGGAVPENCRAFAGKSVPGLFAAVSALERGQYVAPQAIVYGGQPSTMSVSATQVDFTDGTSWNVP